MSQHRITWSNGKVDSARTWQRLLDKVRLDQYREYTEEQFRIEMYKRAMLWSGKEIFYSAAPREFFMELEWAKLIRIDSKEVK